MKLSSPTAALEKLNAKVFFFLLFAFQVMIIFQGIDLTDSGFYAVFYQQIFNAPETVQYNFMFWFSGIVGGSMSYVFPDLGLWGIRLVGVIVTTSTIIVTYNLLKKYLNPGYLKLGLLLVLLFINNNLKEVHYNDLSALMNMLTIVFLFTGLKENKLWKIFVSGMFISLNTFTRIPNILCLGLGFAILYHGYHHRTLVKTVVTQIFIFGAGFVVATGLILGFMKLIGHFDIFVNSIKLLNTMASGGEDSFYGPMVLIKNFFNTYFSAIKTSFFICAAIVIAVAATAYAKKFSFYRKWMADFLKYAIVLALCVLLAMGKIQKEVLLFFFTGLILITTILIVFTKTNKDLKLLALMGCFILLSFPFSSAAGLFSAGIYSVWLSLPIAVDYLYNTSTINTQFTLFRKNAFHNAGLVITEPQFNQVKRWTMVVCIFGCLVYTYRYPFFDRHNRVKMFSSIDNQYLKGVLTTKERAAVMNEVLDELPKYVKPNDYMLCYQNIPMFNYATKTRPYMRNSLPWFYQAEFFKKELLKGYEETKVLPVVIMQKVKTTGTSSNWPDAPPSPDDWIQYSEKNTKRNAYMNEFLQAHNYQEVWSNREFRILVPQQGI